MKGFQILRKYEYLDTFDNPSKDITSMLITSKNGIEMVRTMIQKDGRGILPPIEKGVVEVYCLLEGTLSLYYNNQDVIIHKGDTMILRNYDQAIPYHILENVVMMVSSNLLEYQIHKDTFSRLNKLLDYLQTTPLKERDHIERMQSLSQKLLPYLDLTKEQQDNLFYAILFHDVGKAKLNHQLLEEGVSKTPEYYDEMEQHPLISYSLVVEYFGEEIANIILQHHERVDGKGYPYGMEDEDLCEEAKLLSVINAYDDFIYQKGLSQEEAIEAVKERVGTFFDGHFVDILIQGLGVK